MHRDENEDEKKNVTRRNVRALELHRLFAKHSSVTCIIAGNVKRDVTWRVEK